VDISFLVHVFNFSFIYIYIYFEWWVSWKTRLFFYCFFGFVGSRMYYLVNHCIFMSRMIMARMNLIWEWLKVAACLLFWCLFFSIILILFFVFIDIFYTVHLCWEAQCSLLLFRSFSFYWITWFNLKTYCFFHYCSM
jgi:hypothetical protein